MQKLFMEKTTRSEKQQLNKEADNSFFIFEQKLEASSLEELEKMANDLNYLGTSFDPFSNKEMDAKQNDIIKDFPIDSSDPFKMTNTILKLLDTIEKQIKKRYH